MYIATVPNRNSPPAILLRAGYREGGKVKSRTLANISDWPRQKIEALRRLLRGEKLAPLGMVLDIAASRRRARARALSAIFQRISFAEILAPAPSRERDSIMNTIAALILDLGSKGGAGPLPDVDGARDHALEWLENRRSLIVKQLALRHLKERGAALLDLGSGMLADLHGRPVSIALPPGASGGARALRARIQKIREEFRVATILLVAERDIPSDDFLGELKASGGLDWIMPLKTRAIRKLAEDRKLEPELFDRHAILEFVHPDFPGERFAARRDESIHRARARKHRSALGATTRSLARLQASAAKGSPAGAEKIRAAAKAILARNKTAKFFTLASDERSFSFRVDEAEASLESGLYGVSVLRTSLAAKRLSAADVVSGYSNLGRTQRVFHSMKHRDIKPLPGRSLPGDAEGRNIFLRLLACYVERHMRRA